MVLFGQNSLSFVLKFLTSIPCIYRLVEISLVLLDLRVSGFFHVISLISGGLFLLSFQLFFPCSLEIHERMKHPHMKKKVVNFK